MYNATEKFTKLMAALRKAALFGAAVAAFGTFAVSANADPIYNLVQNNNFDLSTNGDGQLGYNTDATDWTTSGYNFLFSTNGGGGTDADTTGVTGAAGNLQLWGTDNGGADPLTPVPDGGSFIAADGAYDVGSIDQTVNNLLVGESYTLGFYWGGAQQKGFDGATTEGWDVTLGGVEHDTAVINNDNHGFTGWQYQTFSFTATSSSEVLSFLAVGTPNGEPPFALLADVSLSTPEPASMTLMLGFAMVTGAAAFLRKNKLKKQAQPVI
jgi:hypothetical protein